MGLFGEVDIDDISDNPFYVAPDTYLCIISEVKIVTSQNSDRTGLSIKYTIEDEDSEYKGRNVSDWFNLHMDISAEDRTPAVVRDQSNLKKRLVKDLGIAPEDLADLHENLDELVGIMAEVTVKETVDRNDPDKKYTNVTRVVRVEE